jgi:hypothetical protein
MNQVKAWIAAASIAIGALPALASAQMTARMASDADFERGRASSYSLIPFTSYGYAGINLGRSKFDGPCAAAFACDDNSFAGKIYTGGLFSRIIGGEIGYVNMGEVDRAGGTVDAHGVNISLVANLPIDAFNIFAKVGTTYGWTDTSVAPGMGLLGGNDNGFGLSYGAGFGIDLTRSWAVVAEWDRHRFHFVNGKDDVDLYSLGVRFKF